MFKAILHRCCFQTRDEMDDDVLAEMALSVQRKMGDGWTVAKVAKRHSQLSLAEQSFMDITVSKREGGGFSELQVISFIRCPICRQWRREDLRCAKCHRRGTSNAPFAVV